MLTDTDLDLIFRTARTYRQWRDLAVTDETLRAVYELFKWGPTSGNCCPARIIFVKSVEAKARLKPALDEGNVVQTMAAPATAIIAYDLEFYEKLPLLAPRADGHRLFAGKTALIAETASRNGSLQGAYLIIAARALGLDCGPMSGFDNAALDAAFFPDGKIKSNFLCNLGYGDPARLRPRAARLAFEDACRVV